MEIKGKIVVKFEQLEITYMLNGSTTKEIRDVLDNLDQKQEAFEKLMVEK